MPPAKRMRANVSSAAASQIKQVCSDLAAQSHSLCLEEINDRLENSPDKAQQVLFFLKNSNLQTELENDVDDRVLPLYCRRWNLLPLKFLNTIIGELERHLLPAVVHMNKNAMRSLLCFALHVDMNSAVYSKTKATLLASCQERYKEMGCRLSVEKTKSALDAAGLFQLNSVGYFHIKTNNSIESVMGDRIDLPESMKSNTWKLKEPLQFNKASLKCGLMDVLVTKLFEEANITLMLPEYIPMAFEDGRAQSPGPCTPTPSRSPGTPARSLGGDDLPVGQARGTPTP